MGAITRRSAVGGVLGLAASTALARPYIANAQAKTAVCWLNQGFIPQEDAAMRKVCEDYMKASGNKLDYSIMPFMALNQKTVSALTSGDVPDLVFMDAPSSIIPQNAWDDKIMDVSDVVKPYESQLHETAKLGSTFYNKATKKRSYYLCPIKQGATPFHIWGDLVEKAGFKMSDLVSVTVYVTDLNDVKKMNEVYIKEMPNPKPARATVQVAGLIGGAKIEIAAVAVKH